MTLLYLVRHGETDWNRARRIQGLTDIRLNDTGRAQARTTAQLLARRTWTNIVSSPLSRAAETAEIIATELSMHAPTLLSELTERNYGEAEGLTNDELSVRYPDDAAVVGRESREEVVARAIPALIGLAQRTAGGSIIVVSHGGVIRSILKAIEPASGPHHSEQIRNGSVHTLRCTGDGLELVVFDDPIEEESEALGSENFLTQNAIEGRGN